MSNITEYGTGGAAAVIIAVTQFDATILAGTNSITVTHNLGRLAKVNGVYGIDANANVFEILNEGVNSFDIALFGGILAGANTAVQGTYV